MSYLLDKKIQKKKFLRTTWIIIILIVLIYFRSPIFSALSFLSHTVFRPVLVLGGGVGSKFNNFTSYFLSKNSLYLDNQNLRSKIAEDEAQMANYNSVLAENASLKDILGRKGEKINLTLSAILEKPNQSPYDTLVVDAGTNQGLKSGDTVFALGNVPIGRVADIFPLSSKVILFSSPGEKTQVVVGDKNIFMEIVGRGGGNFEMVIPSDFTPKKGDEVFLPGITPYVVAKVETVISDPRDSFIKALLTSPVNIQELRFVEVEK